MVAGPEPQHVMAFAMALAVVVRVGGSKDIGVFNIGKSWKCSRRCL